MIHYHGAPISGSGVDQAKFFAGRHAMVSFAAPGVLPVVAEVAQSFVLDNGAFSVNSRGAPLDIPGYLAWVREWSRHPGLDWAVIPDVIEGDEAANDALLTQWPSDLPGVPVWHLHESLERLEKLSRTWRMVALGFSGQWSNPGSVGWWNRMTDAMAAVCDDGRPRCRLHGLGILNPEIFRRLPLASADSTNAGRNAFSNTGFGYYAPLTAWQRAVVIADRVEAHNSAAIWTPSPQTAFDWAEA